jgi:hypothetical protein
LVRRFLGSRPENFREFRFVRIRGRGGGAPVQKILCLRVLRTVVQTVSLCSDNRTRK